MKRFLSILLVLSLLLAGCANEPQPTQTQTISPTHQATMPPVTPMQSNAGGGNPIAYFGEALFNNVQNGEETNPVISPLSAYLALGMTSAGAKGDTADAFSSVLGIQPNESIAPAEDVTNRLLNTSGSTKLSIANSIWADDRLVLNGTYEAEMKRAFKADIFKQDLQAQNTAKDMNAWVSEKTNGLIDSMVDQTEDD